MVAIGLDNNPSNRYVIYSRDDCPWCVKAKDLLELHNLPYTEYKLGVHFTRDTLAEKLLKEDVTALTVPQIYYNGKYIGGHDRLVQYLEEHSGGFGDGGFL